MPLWFTTRDGDIWAWTYGKSQKVRNLERDPRATLQVETGESYDQLRGVMIEARTAIHRDPEVILEFGLGLFKRYSGGGQGPGFENVVRAQAAKRVALQFTPESTASFDHRKLGAGVY
jgi:hypothetical protein